MSNDQKGDFDGAIAEYNQAIQLHQLDPALESKAKALRDRFVRPGQ
jgi:hypothetical protein